MKCFYLGNVFLFIFYFAHSQNITGKWTGIFNTSASIAANQGSFFMHMELKQYGNKIIGNTVVDYPKGKTIVYQVNGTLVKSNLFQFSLTGNNPLADNANQGQTNFFIDLNNIAFTKNDTAQILSGKWIAVNLPMNSVNESGGVFWAGKVDTMYNLQNEEFFTVKNKIDVKKIKKTPLLKSMASVLKIKQPVSKKESVPITKPYEKRKNIITDTLVVSSAEIIVELFDNGEIDGDSVSVYVNNKPILLQKELKSTPIKFALSVEKNKQYTITLFAENLGRIPPNTAVMIVRSGTIRKTIFLSADLNSNVSVIIKAK